MKLDARTITVLKNFSNIQTGIIVKPGNVLSTLSSMKTVMARATVPNTFERPFAIYDLSRFLGVLSLFENPELHFDEKHLDIVSGNSKVRYVYGDPSTIMAAPDKELALPSVDVEFELTDEMMAKVRKIMSSLQAPDMAIAGEDGKLLIKALDVKNPTGDVFSTEIGETDKDFFVIYKAENLSMMPITYRVQISSKLISSFTGQDIKYWVAVDSNSRFK